MLDRLRALLNRPSTAEDDVEPDTHVARTRETGGTPDDTGDRGGPPAPAPPRSTWAGSVARTSATPGRRGPTPRQPLTAGPRRPEGAPARARHQALGFPTDG